MSASTPSVSAHPLPAWKIWANPIFRRYARSRLRPRALTIWILLTLIFAAFLFFLLRTITIHRVGLALADAERAPLIPLLVLQSVILFVLGTGQVAGGMTAEGDEGVLDYQRLTPMTPLSKVLGYLFGLPVREYVMFLATLPFTIWSLWAGAVPAKTWFSLYVVFLSSALLYHLTGLVAGTVIKNRRWAFLLSIGMVFLLYTVIPQAARFGLVFFKYFTLAPVFQESFAHFMPENAARAVHVGRALANQGVITVSDVRFFNLHFSETIFTLFTQGVLILTFLVMLWRRWRRPESHLLGKIWAVALFAWTQIVLLGNALPLVEPGLLFPSREIRRRAFAAVNPDWAPALGEAVGMIGLYGLATLCILVVLTSIITATEDEQLRGLRRARKLGWVRIPFFSDPAGSIWFVVVMALLGAVGWMFFARGLIQSAWFAGTVFPAHGGWTFALVLLSAGLGFQAMLEARGGRWPFFATLFIGVVPMMIGSILSAANNSFLTASTWLAGMSPLSAPFYAAQTLVPASLPTDAALALPRAFWFWQIVTALVVVGLIIQLWRIRKQRALLTTQPPETPASLPAID